MSEMTPEHRDALSAVRNEIALARFACHGLNGGLALGEAEIDGLYATLDRWHRTLSLALDTPEDPGHD